MVFLSSAPPNSSLYPLPYGSTMYKGVGLCFFFGTFSWVLFLLFVLSYFDILAFVLSYNIILNIRIMLLFLRSLFSSEGQNEMHIFLLLRSLN